MQLRLFGGNDLRFLQSFFENDIFSGKESQHPTEEDWIHQTSSLSTFTMLSPSILPPFILLSSIMNYAAAQTCFYPNGDVDTSGTPCNKAAEFSHCCGPLDLCLDNGYCFTSGLGDWGNRLARISCTDPQWQSAACPQYCDDGELLLDAQVMYYTGLTIILL